MDTSSSVTGVADEAALLDALRAGEEQAFETLVRGYLGRMRATAVRLLRNREDADDVVQEAFLSAFKGIDRFEGRSGLGTWLHRITINAALMRLRSRKDIVEEDVEELLPRFRSRGPFVEHQAAWGEDPGDPLAREELCEAVRAHIDELPEKYRIPLVLRDIEGIQNEELARQLGVTVNAAKIRVHRARQALRALLEPRWRQTFG